MFMHGIQVWVALPEGKRRPLAPVLDERYRFVEMGGIPKQAAAA